MLLSKVDNYLIHVLTEQLLPPKVIEAYVLRAADQNAFLNHCFSPVMALFNHCRVLVLFSQFEVVLVQLY